MTTQNNNYINNEWRSASGKPFFSRCAATGEKLWQGFSANEAEVKAAVAAARKGFETWAIIPIDERIKHLELFVKALQEVQDKLALTISKEVGKPLWESKGEVSSMISKIAISIEAYQQRCKSFEKTHPAGKAITVHKPHGVIAILGPFNFPGHIPNGHIVPALLAGNSVVFKPSEMTPLVGEEMIRCWEKCGLPPGVINLVQGDRDTGRFLSSQRDINGLLFTGSFTTGLILSELFAKTPERILALELGGNNPLIVDEPEDVEAAAYIALQSAFLTSGQRCSCTRRLIVTKGKQSDAFIKALINQIQGIKVGYYRETPEPFMGPVISERAASHLLAAPETLFRNGGKPLVQMHLKAIDTALLTPGLVDVTGNLSADEEVFGPLLQLIRVSDFDKAISEANSTAYGLTAGLISSSEEKYKQFFQQIRAGVISWNAPTTGSSSGAPFGGIKRSGNFRPSGYYAADYCSYPVAIIEGSAIKMPEKLLPGLGT
jgi:succinylglutamic semialdehyde dehydrogenase